MHRAGYWALFGYGQHIYIYILIKHKVLAPCFAQTRLSSRENHEIGQNV